MPPLLGHSFPLAANYLYMHHPTDRITFHNFCNTSFGALAGTRNTSVDPPDGIDPMTHCTTNAKHINYLIQGLMFNMLTSLKFYVTLMPLARNSLKLKVANIL